MTALGIRYLTGCSVATNLAMPGTPEFPPHFGRVFMAMAAAYFETRGTDEERGALEWLEAAGAPSIAASGGSARSFTETYVPVNDKHGGIARRSRLPRSFPTFRPDSPLVYLVWESDLPDALREPLERICGKVTRIGHSSSLVQMWLADAQDSITAEWFPSDSGAERQMRIAEPGTLQYLETIFNGKAIEEYSLLSDELVTAKGKEKNRLKQELTDRFPEGIPEFQRPKLTKWQGYVRVAVETPHEGACSGPFDPELIVLRAKEEQPVLGLPATLQLTSALRDAMMKSVGENVPEWLSGHEADGTPTKRPHAALFPLPFVGSKHADGHVMGMAIAIPRQLEAFGEGREETLRRVIGGFLFRDTGEEKTVTLWQGHSWRWEAERERRENPGVSLRATTWTGPSRQWASVTPVVLHHYPKRNRDGEIERILMQAFESAGLPAPVAIRTQPVSFFEGAGHARSMPEFTEGGAALCRYQTHVIVRFSAPVSGPVLVGRGRFRGYGLLRPVEVKRG